MPEKRNHKRIYPSETFNVYDRNTNKLIGRMENYSIGGLMLTSSAPVRRGDTLDCKLILPDDVTGSKEVCFKAKIAWCDKDINPGTYTIGFQFQDIDPEELRLIAELAQGLLAKE